MKLNNFLIFTYCILMAASTFARVKGPLDAPILNADPKLSTDEKLGTGFLFSIIDKVKNNLPEGKLSCAINKYSQVLGIEKYQSTYHMGKTTEG
ncbi:MAG TPA: hypothetical protein VIG33_12280 [Pseudobdellovibrionaceae bacterium]|jgi:hypothetical protein